MCTHTFPLTRKHSLPIPLLVFLSLPSCRFSPRSLYLTHTVIVKPRVQMLHSVPPPFSMWSCEKSHEPSRMHQPCQTPHPHNSSLWTQQRTTQTLSKNTFCWPTLSGTLLPNGSGWAELRSERWNGVGVRMGVKSIKVIWQTFYFIAFVTLSAVFSRRLPLISTSGQFGLVCMSLPPCGEGMPMHL